MKVKEENEKAGLKLTILKTKIRASGPITSCQIDGKKWKQWQSLFSWIPKSLDGDWSHDNQRCLLLVRKAITNLVQLSSVAQSYMTLCNPMDHNIQVSLSITNSRSLPKLMSIELVMTSNHLILCRSLPLLPSIFSSIRVFSNESALHIRWPKYLECQLRHQSFQLTPRTDLL